MEAQPGAEARGAAQHDARAQGVVGEEIAERVGEEAAADPPALSVVDREFEGIVRHSRPPSSRPAQTAATPRTRLTATLAAASLRSPSSPRRWVSSTQVLNVV